MQKPNSEGKLRKAFVDALIACAAEVVPYPGSTFGRVGTADIYLSHFRWQGWIEFKGPKTLIEPEQILFCHAMRKSGSNSIIVRLLSEHTFMIEPDTTEYTWLTGVDILYVLSKVNCKDWTNVGCHKESLIAKSKMGRRFNAKDNRPCL